MRVSQKRLITSDIPPLVATAVGNVSTVRGFEESK